MSSIDLAADPDVLLHDARQFVFLLFEAVLCLRELLGQGFYLLGPLLARRRPIAGRFLEIGDRLSQVRALFVF